MKEPKFPYVRKLIADKTIKIVGIAYLDIILENRMNILVAGPYDARKHVIPAVKELVSQYGRIFNIRTAGTLNGILCGDETPFEQKDTVVVNLDQPDKKLAKAYIKLMNTERIKGIAEISGETPKKVVNTLETYNGLKRKMISDIDVLLLTGTNNKDVRVMNIIEVLGIESETKDVITNSYYTLDPETGDVTALNSFNLRKFMSEKMTDGEINKVLEAREKKFEKL
jgi:hypothetical protein